MKKIVSIFFIFNVLLIQTFAQGAVLRGKVTDQKTGEPIPGVTVVELDQNNRVIRGTITGPNGNYVLEVKNTDSKVQFSFVGYKAQTIELSGQTSLNIELLPEAIGIDEVVVQAETSADELTGVSERNRASSATEVDMAEMMDASVTSASDALQGQVAGLDIVSSGSPGGSSSIVIRGLGTLGNAEPLIVVDGIAQNVNISDDFDFGSANTEDIGDLVNISPQDIQSIRVLKDAASAAKWGSRAADGVLEIETHRGQKGKTRFEYQYKGSFTREPPPMPMLNGDEYVIMQLEEYHNRYGVFDIPDQIAFDEDFKEFNNWNKNTDWIDAITRDGVRHEHNFKVSGGGDKTRYYASLSLNNDEGTTVNESLERLTTRINLDYDVSSKLRFSVFFNYTNSYKEDNAWLYRYWNVRRMAYIKPSNMSVWEYDENNKKTGDYYAPDNAYQGSGEFFYNPVAMTHLSMNDVASNQFENNFKLRYNIFSWLDFRETVSFQYKNQKRARYLPEEALGTDWLDNSNDRSMEQNKYDVNITTRSLLSIRPITTTVHVLNGSLMWETRQSTGGGMAIVGTQTPSSKIIDPASNPVVNWNGANLEETRDLGALASLNYIYKDKYIINSTFRADASSKFGENNRWGMFPSVAVAWRFTNEPWFAALKTIIPDGKFRMSYGQVGKQPKKAYIRHGLYEAPNPGQYINNPILIPVQMQLENLKWQTVEQWNYALDISMFENRLFIVFEYYDKITKDVLWEKNTAYEIPSTSGYNKLPAYNGGALENKGWEFSANGTVIKFQDLIWRLNMNISRNRNSYTAFPENFNNERATNVANEEYPRQANLGQPVGSFYGFDYLGVYPTNEDAVARDADGNIKLDAKGKPIPMIYKDEQQFEGGDARYADLNHDGVIDINDVIYLGDSNPEFYGGFGTSLNYKSIRISASFNYRVGYEIVNELAMNTQGMTGKNNQSTAVLHRWRREGQNEEGMLPRAYLFHPSNNLGSDRYVEPGDYLRLNNLSISFRMPKRIEKMLNLLDLRAGVNMRKIWTLTPYTGQDPEISSTIDDPFWFGTDNGQSPAPKVYSFNINIRF